MSPPFAEVLRGLAAAFAELDVGYYLFGAQAALVYGAARLTIDGVRFPVACPEDLIAMKILSGRPEDLQDVEAIVAAHLDTRRVRETLSLLEPALDQSDHVSQFVAIHARSPG